MRAHHPGTAVLFGFLMNETELARLEDLVEGLRRIRGEGKGGEQPKRESEGEGAGPEG